ncbi:MAG: hypothetical protein J5979_03705 [Lachnospiraceae bacterium]|nr:hypothetical protein [Lachnospiraceae bacterium]
MAKFRVTQELDYITGHLRYGHREGTIEADSLEDAKKKIEKDGYDDCLDLVVDDYRTEDWSAGSNPFEYERIEE